MGTSGALLTNIPDLRVSQAPKLVEEPPVHPSAAVSERSLVSSLYAR